MNRPGEIVTRHGLGFAVLLAAALLTAPAQADPTDKRNSIMMFGGVATKTPFVKSMFMPWENDIENVGVVGLAYDYRFGTATDFIGDFIPPKWGEHILIEGEGGVSARMGDEQLGEAWVGLYLRYDDFPWNDTVFTTIAVNTGISVLTGISEFEKMRDDDGKASEILHYMGPEITFADPDRKELELVLRFHHRSGAFGAFDGVVSGSTFISSGIRVRF